MYCTQAKALYRNSLNAQAPRKLYPCRAAKKSRVGGACSEGTYRAIFAIDTKIGENPRYIKVSAIVPM